MRGLNSGFESLQNISVLIQFCLQVDDWKKIILENAFEHKEKKPELNLTPG